MIRTGQTIEKPLTGERVTFEAALVAGAAIGRAAATSRSTSPPASPPPRPRTALRSARLRGRGASLRGRYTLPARP
jgi:hypothetical protein